MALRGGARAATGVAKKHPIGAVRRAQQITTYGVGSMIAVGEQSFIVSGLDSWKVPDTFVVYEPRLEQSLKVDEFRLPPAAEPPIGDGVRVRRFPDLYSCPECGRLDHYRAFGDKGPCGACEGRTTTPSRFVVACPNGHLDEFPYWAWVHRRTEPSAAEEKCELRLFSNGRTAGLRSIVIRCTCGKSASMEGAFGAKALVSLGITCRGRRPWLGRGTDEPGCDQAPRVLQRGASAAWFPVVRSAISIPPWHQVLMQKVLRERKFLVGEDEEWIARFASRAGWLNDYRPEEVVNAVRTLEKAEAAPDENPDADADPGEVVVDPLRVEEYRQLRTVTPDDPENEHFVCVPPDGVAEADPVPGIGLTMVVKRLREVRVLRTFTRIEPPTQPLPEQRRAAMSRDPDALRWLPAVEVSGEGVFLEMDLDRLVDWERSRAVRDRTAILTAAQLSMTSGDDVPAGASPVTPRFVLIHTLAHALINEWSLDSGYPAAALRERLYVSDDMAGVLIYTATSDSAGSLGGLVSQGAPERLARSLASAVRRIQWCSADPLCMESDASGVNGLNLAACHACVLLPETSCENNNTFLDRAMLVGMPDMGMPGYFDDRL